jgi:hypothetical protein
MPEDKDSDEGHATLTDDGRRTQAAVGTGTAPARPAASGSSLTTEIEVPDMCPHTPPCPASHAWDHAAARTIAAHPEQGWSLLCNCVIVFDDTGELLPGGLIVLPRPAVLPALRSRAFIDSMRFVV